MEEAKSLKMTGTTVYEFPPAESGFNKLRSVI